MAASLPEVRRWHEVAYDSMHSYECSNSHSHVGKYHDHSIIRSPMFSNCRTLFPTRSTLPSPGWDIGVLSSTSSCSASKLGGFTCHDRNLTGLFLSPIAGDYRFPLKESSDIRDMNESSSYLPEHHSIDLRKGHEQKNVTFGPSLKTKIGYRCYLGGPHCVDHNSWRRVVSGSAGFLRTWG